MNQLLTAALGIATRSLLMTLLPLGLWAAGFEFKTQKFDTEDGKNSALKVVGCTQITDRNKQDVAMSKCLEDAELKKSVTYYWKLDSNRKNVIGCEHVTESTKPAALIADQPLSTCIAKLPYTKTWTLNGRDEIDGCKGIAKYRGVEVPLTDFDSCYNELAKDLEYVFLADSTKPQGETECLVKSGGKTFANPKYAKRKCSFAKENPAQVFFSQDRDAKPEYIVNAWSENKEGACLAVAETSVRILGVVDKSRCDEAILKIVDGVRKLVNSNVQKRTYTFRKMLLDPKLSANMQRELGAECSATINKISQKAGSLASKTLAAAAVPLGTVRVHSGVQDNLFYHWTSSAGLFDLFKLRELTADLASARAKKENTYEQMFYFLRTRTADQYQFWRRVFYVAEDTQSSAFLGSSLLEFTLDPKAKTVVYNLATWQAAMDEVAAKHPELAQNCKMKLDWDLHDTFGRVMFSNMFFIVAEDSGINVIEFNQGGRWFQILGSEPFVSLRVAR